MMDAHKPLVKYKAPTFPICRGLYPQALIHLTACENMLYAA